MKLEIELYSLEDIPEDKLRLNLKLYSFDTTIDEIKRILSQQEEILRRQRRSGMFGEEITLIKVLKVLENNRGTVKLALFSNKKLSFITKETVPEDISMSPRSWDYKGTGMFDLIKEGMWVVLSTYSWRRDRVVARYTDAFTKEDAEKWLQLYEQCLERKDKYNTFEEFSPVSTIPSAEVISISDLERHLVAIDEKIREIEELERQEEEKKKEALEKRIQLTDTQIVIDALDEHKYTIEVPSHNWKKEDWLPFIYRHRYQWKQYEQQRVRENTFFSDIFNKLAVTQLEWFKLGVDDKPIVEISLKKVKSRDGRESTLAYIEGKRVAYYDMYMALQKYFYKGEELKTEELKENEDERKKQLQEIRKQREEELMTKGITGYLHDLEGEVPISIFFEKEKNNWYLLIGEKRLLLKGGVATIKSLERVLTGKALTYSARHSTEEFFRRLSNVLGEEQTLEIIEEAKRFGKLASKLEGR